MNYLAIDTETTGVDFIHGCKPFLISACDGEENFIWEGEVNPYTREVFWDEEVLREIRQTIKGYDRYVFQNAGFDIEALQTIGIAIDFSKIEDVLVAGHLICSGDVHGLKDMAIKYLHYFDDDEEELEAAVKNARTIAGRKGYAIAKYGHPHFPGLKKNAKWWKMDFWLAMDACRKYAAGDAERTYALWEAFRINLNAWSQWKTYRERMELVEVFYEAKLEGLNLNVENAFATIRILERKIRKIQAYITKEIKAVTKFDWNKKQHVKELLHFHLKIPKTFKTPKGNPSTNKEALAFYIRNNKHPWLKAVAKGMKLETELRYLRSYISWLGDDGRIHANTNITGTRETRQSSSSPNLQNITESIARLFEPPEGYVWFYADFKNIELRLWAYLTNNEELISAFENNISVHMLIFELLYPQQANAYLKYPDDLNLQKLYRKIKGGTFSRIYGASEEKTDDTYGIKGAVRKIEARFPGIKQFNDSCVNEVMRNIELMNRPCLVTLLDYPLDIPVDETHKAPNYKIQGSAGMIMGRAIKNIKYDDLYKKTYSIIIQQVHDSLRIQIPISKDTEAAVKRFANLMETCVVGEFGVTPVDYEVQYNQKDKTRLLRMGIIEDTEPPF
jgi:DNA polymerase I-like protein with 3'-5' exonuclease and polymerase domains